jgi:hypothetical protein
VTLRQAGREELQPGRIINQVMERLRRNQPLVVDTNTSISLKEYLAAAIKADLPSKRARTVAD